LALAAGAPPATAAGLASAAAGVVVGKERTATCSAQDLRDCFTNEGKLLLDRQRLRGRRELDRQQELRVVFTNGCFDMLHPGHVSLLDRAKALGHILIVGVNSDSSIRRLKGPNRPVNPLHERLQVLAALSCVDHVVAFEEDTPCSLIRM